MCDHCESVGTPDDFAQGSELDKYICSNCGVETTVSDVTNKEESSDDRE